MTILRPGWWICPNCGIDNPPLVKLCLRCQTPMVPGSAEPFPPAPPAPPVDWKTGLKWIGVVSSLALNAWFLIGNLFPPGIGAVVKMALEVLRGVFQ